MITNTKLTVVFSMCLEGSLQDSGSTTNYVIVKTDDGQIFVSPALVNAYLADRDLSFGNDYKYEYFRVTSKNIEELILGGKGYMDGKITTSTNDVVRNVMTFFKWETVKKAINAVEYVPYKPSNYAPPTGA